jgi:HK97 family phage prohead protease
MTEITFEIQEDFTVDVAKRTIRGIAVPYGVTSSLKNGRKFRFSKGFAQFTDLSRIKILVDHDNSQAVGRVIALDDTDTALWVTFSVKHGPEGDRVLHEALQKVKDGLSIGIFDPVEFTEDSNGVLDVTSAVLREITVTAMPSFDDARMTLVNFSLEKEEIEMPDTDDKKTEVAAVDFSGLTAALTAGFSQVIEKINEKPEVVTNEPLFVSEPAPYRFDRMGELRPGKYSFSKDLIGGLKAVKNGGDSEAIAGYERALKFMQEQFADVDSTDGAALNPNKPRPDLYVDQRDYDYPLVRATLAGSLEDPTPFVIPKFNTASGLVSTLTEATEPANGTFTATDATVTPVPVGGKVEITRKVWDQGGNPKIDGLIWHQMVKGWYEALEARVVAALDAVTPTGITITTAVVDDVLSGELGAAIAALQYVRGGFAFDTFAIQIDLYKALADAVDGNKRPLFPIINPQNANGQSAPRYGTMNVHGVNGFPEWALAATGTSAASSYLFDHESVKLWATTPERIDWNFGSTVQTANISQLSHVTLGIYGYAVAAVTDLTGVREVIYDPAA